MSIDHLPSRDAIYDLIDANQVAPLGMAIAWAVRTDAPELTEFYEALFCNLERQGNCNADSCGVSRATAILLDAYFESKGRKAA